MSDVATTASLIARLEKASLPVNLKWKEDGLRGLMLLLQEGKKSSVTIRGVSEVELCAVVSSRYWDRVPRSFTVVGIGSLDQPTRECILRDVESVVPPQHFAIQICAKRKKAQREAIESFAGLARGAKVKNAAKDIELSVSFGVQLREDGTYEGIYHLYHHQTLIRAITVDGWTGVVSVVGGKRNQDLNCADLNELEKILLDVIWDVEEELTTP